jgi:hypothetical protein
VSVEASPPLQEHTARFMQMVREQGEAQEGRGTDIMNWLLVRVGGGTSVLTKAKALELVLAIVATASLPMQTLAYVSLPVFEECREFPDDPPGDPGGAGAPAAATAGAAKRVRTAAADIVDILQDAQQRVLEGRRQRRAAKAAERERLRQRAAVLGRGA